MFRIIKVFIVCLLVLLFRSEDLSAAWPWGDANTLVTINGEAYTPEDYKRWWGLWKEKKDAVPEDPQSFIEWKLLAQEARSMELDQLPSYQRKVRVYLKSRGRMHLKYDEVDSQIQRATEQEIKARYDSDYSPIWLGTSLYFDSLDKANDAYRSVSEKTLSVEELIHQEPADGGPVKRQQNIIRPINIKHGKNPIAAAVQDLAVGEISEPVPYSGHVYFVFVLQERIDFDPDDFAKRKKSIRENLIKKRQAILTNELIEKLKKKYNVQVDEKLFAKTTGDLSGEILNRPIVTTSNGNIPLYLLVKDIRKNEQINKRKLSLERQEIRKAGLLNGMIAEYLLTWEARGRHYEEKPPLKWSYEFYQENRLIKELENEMLHRQISITDEDIAEYYKLHLEKYRGPSIASIAMLEDEGSLIKRIWEEISLGQDFFIVAKRYYTMAIPIKDIVIQELSPELVEPIQKLSIGEVSSPIELGEKYALVKLINRQPAKPLPLKSVGKSIKQEIYKEEYSGLRQAYVEKILEQSQIELNKRVWKNLYREMTSGN